MRQDRAASKRRLCVEVPCGFAALIAISLASTARAADPLGLRFGPVVPLNSGGTTGILSSSGVRLDADGRGVWIAAWTASDTTTASSDSAWRIWFARSTNSGGTWSAPRRLSQGSTQTAHYRPDIVTDNVGTWLAVWKAWDGANLEIQSSRSTDNGATWTTGPVLSRWLPLDATRDLAGRVPLATDRSGRFMAVWDRTTSSAGRAVFEAHSLDRGRTWSLPQTLARPRVQDRSYWDEYPAVAADGAGVWVALWRERDSLGGKRVTVMRSADAGQHWSDVAGLTSPSLQVFHTPAIASDGHGSWVIAYSGVNGPSAAYGENVDLALWRTADSGASWGFETWRSAEFDGSETRDSAPAIAADGQGRWVLIWQFSIPFTFGPFSLLSASASFQHTRNWITPTVVRLPSVTMDLYPAIATDRLGGWFAAWQNSPDVFVCRVWPVGTAVRFWGDYE